MWAGNFHHIPICYLVFKNLLNPDCDNAYPFMVLYDDLCYYSVDKYSVYTMMVTCGYLTYDGLLLSIFFTKERPITY